MFGSMEQAANGPVYWMPIRVYYEDTDAGGIVYHANYLRYMERARTEWMRAIGMEQDEFRRETGLIFVVVDMQIRYHVPAKFNELLLVNASIGDCKRATMTFNQMLYRHQPDQPSNAAGAGELLVSASARAACIRETDGRPVPLPDAYFKEFRHGH